MQDIVYNRSPYSHDTKGLLVSGSDACTVGTRVVSVSLDHILFHPYVTRDKIFNAADKYKFAGEISRR